MAEVAGNLVRCAASPKCGDVVCAFAARVPLRKVLFRDTHANTFGVLVEVTANQIEIAQCRSYQNVRGTAARHQIASDILAIARIMPRLNYADHMLRRCGFMYVVTCV